MSSDHALNYLARNSRKNKHNYRNSQASPLTTTPKPKRKDRSLTTSAIQSRKCSITSASLGNSCNISRGQIRIQDPVEQECLSQMGSRQVYECEKSGFQVLQQNNLITQYFRRVQILEQTKKEDELFSLKNCLHFRELSQRIDPLALIQEEEQSNSSEKIDHNEPVSPISTNNTLNRAKSKEIFQSYHQNQVELNPQYPQVKQQESIFVKKKSIPLQQSSSITNQTQQLEKLMNQLSNQQFQQYDRELKRQQQQTKQLKKRLLQQEKQKYYLNSLLQLLKMNISSEPYLLASPEDEDIHKNRILIHCLIKQTTK